MFGMRKEMDERAVAIEHKAGHAGFVVMGYLLVLVLGLRGWKPGILDWNGFPADILLIAFGGGAAHLFVVVRERTLGPRRGLLMGLGVIVSAALAALLVWILSR